MISVPLIFVGDFINLLFTDLPMDFSGRLAMEQHNARNNGIRAVKQHSRESDISDCDSDIDIVGDPKSLGYIKQHQC